MALTILITNAGRAALVNADKSGTRAVRIVSVGLSPTAITPAATATTLPGEIKRITTLSGDQVAADMIHLVVRDEGDAVYTVRSFALYLDDGTLFAIYGQADVIVEKSAQALLLLAIDVALKDIAASSITFGNTSFLLPPATTERQGVVELATAEEGRAGTDTTRAVTPAVAKASVLAWLGYTPVQMGTGIGQSNNAVKIGWSGTCLKVTVDYVDLGPIVFDGDIANVWRSSNDGAGSGLDADMLDGRQATEFVLKSGDTFGGQVAMRAPGFGLRISNPGTGYGFLQLGEAAGADVNLNWHLGSLGDGAFSLFQGEWGTGIERLRVTSGGFNFNGGPVWHAGNDGAGSGLDADLVDGWQADDLRRWGNMLDRPGSFPPSAHTHGAADIAGAFAAASLAPNGYQILPNGLILQWGGVVLADGSGVSRVTFPIAFPTEIFAHGATNDSGSSVAAAWAGTGDASRTGMAVSHTKSALVASAIGTAAHWWAIGR